MVTRAKLLYEGKAKKIYETDDADLLIQYFKDDATAFNAEKRGSIAHKGECNIEISSIIFKILKSKGIKNHYVDRLSDKEMLISKVDIIPIEVVVRNVIAGSLSKRLGKDEGEKLPFPIVEFYYKDDALGDPMITEDHIAILNLASPDELAYIKREALKVNDILIDLFDKIDLILIDYKLEFGKTCKGEILLADEITPDGCRLWDKKTLEKMDKDRFRRDLGKLTETYEEVRDRVRTLLG